MRKFSIGIFLALFLQNLSLFSQIDNNKLTSEQWKEDLHYLVEEMPKVHINAYHTTSKETFGEFASDLSNRIPGMTDNQIVSEFAKMVAMIGDGHTALNIFGFHNQGVNTKQVISFHFFPVRLYLFSDGIYVTGSGGEYKNIIGMKLKSINNTGIDKVLDLVKPLVGRDNEYSIKQFIPLYLITAEYLNGLGIIDDFNNVKFTFEDEKGLTTTINIKPVELQELHPVIAENVLKNVPLYMQNDEKNYWFQYLDDKKTLYINYKRVLTDPEDTLKYFCKKLAEFIDTHEIEKTIIDIRNNGGGDNGTCQPFVNLITNSKKINIRGKLFTIIGRQTFSAASYLTTKLEFNTNSIFIGEPTGASPNHYGDNRAVVLPNSGIETRLSTIYWQNSFSFDTRKTTEPEINVELTSADYFAGKDPVLETIFNYDEGLDKKPAGSQTENIAGKYVYDPMKILEIKIVDNILMMEVRQKDFVGRDVTYISTPLYIESGKTLSTGIDGLKLITEIEPYKLSYRGYEIDIPKADGNFKTPVQLLDGGSTEKAIDIMRKIKSENPANIDLSERNINGLGYELLKKKNIEGAIAVFKLNVELYPQSFNTYDSLGEVYLIAGNKELAAENYERSVQINPQNLNGKKVLDEIKAQK